MTAKSNNILKELESDDEFPDVYNDMSIQPAYLNDNRFDEIKFPWLNDTNLDCTDDQSNIYSYEDKYGVLQGIVVLKQQDIYCLQSLQSLTCSSTLIWFVNFLLHKDIQSKYNFFRSCLVKDDIAAVPLTKKVDTKSNDTVFSDRFEIVIKH